MNKIWSISVGIFQKPPYLYRNNIYLLSQSGDIEAIDKTGKRLWSLPIRPLAESRLKAAGEVPATTRLTKYFPGPPMIGVGDAIIAPYSNSVQGNLFSLNAHNGKLWWHITSDRRESKLKGPILSGICSTRHKVICRTRGGLSCFDLSSGRFLWNSAIDDFYKAVGSITGPPVPGMGKIFIGADLGFAHAFRIEDGCRLWGYRSEGMTRIDYGRSSGIASIPTRCISCLTGNLFVTSDGAGNLIALDAASGHMKWQHKVGMTWQIMESNDQLLVVGENGLHLLSAKTGRTIRAHKVEGGFFSCCTNGKYLFACKNYHVNPGWEILNPESLKPVWNDNKLAVTHGMSTGGDAVYLGVTENFNSKNQLLSMQTALVCYKI